MIGRLFSLILAAGLIAFAVLIHRPDLYGPKAPAVILGAYEPYRAWVGYVAGMMGLIFLIAAVFRRDKEAHETMPAPEPHDAHGFAVEDHHYHAEAAPEADHDPDHDNPHDDSHDAHHGSGGGSPTAKPLW